MASLGSLSPWEEKGNLPSSCHTWRKTDPVSAGHGFASLLPPAFTCIRSTRGSAAAEGKGKVPSR